jgi:hypothetical protein
MLLMVGGRKGIMEVWKCDGRWGVSEQRLGDRFIVVCRGLCTLFFVSHNRHELGSLPFDKWSKLTLKLSGIKIQ